VFKAIRMIADEQQQCAAPQINNRLWLSAKFEEARVREWKFRFLYCLLSCLEKRLCKMGT